MIEIIYREGGQWVWNSGGRLYRLPWTVTTETEAQEYVAAKRRELGFDMNYRLRIGARQEEI